MGTMMTALRRGFYFYFYFFAAMVCPFGWG